MLLAFDPGHLHRQFCRTDDLRHKLQAPAPQLCAITQIEVFGQRIGLPAARIVNGPPPPDAARAIKIHEQT